MLNRRRHGIRVFGYFLLELVVVASSFFIAHYLRSATSQTWGKNVGPLSGYLWLLPVSVMTWGALFWLQNTYEGFRGRSSLMHGATAALTCVLGSLVLFAFVTILKHYEVNRSLIGVLGVTTFLALFATRVTAMAFLAHYTQKGYDRHYVVIGGALQDGLALAETLEEVRGGVFQVRGFLTENPAELGREIGRWKVLGSLQELPALAARMPVDEVYLLPGETPLERNLDLIRQCEAMGMTVHLRLSSFEKTISRLELMEVAGGDYLRFTTAPKSGTALFAKRLIDVAAAALLLLLLSPFLLIVALLVKLTSRGPAVFRQERAGMSGRTFTLYKFRTMAEGAEKDRQKLEVMNEMDGPVFKIKADPRVTGLGRILRKTSIDELPQLWNVVKGDLSLVGPRPLPIYEVETFEPWQRRRMSMRPGITCLWQISGRNKVTTFVEWMQLDLEYVDRWSLGLDFKILLLTIPAVLGGKGAY